MAPDKDLKELADTFKDAMPKSAQVCCFVIPAFCILGVMVPLIVALFRWALS